MKKWKYVCGFAIFFMCLCGCKSQKNTSQELVNGMFQNNVGKMEAGGGAELEDGYIMEIGDQNRIMVYFDDSTKSLTPLCMKADCKHAPGDESCIATLLAKDSVSVCVYQGEIWYQKEIDSSTTALYRSSVTGENAVEVCVIQAGISLSGYDILYQEKLYKTDVRSCVNEKGLLDGFKERLFCLDMESGEEKEIEPEKHTEAIDYRIIGMKNGKLYYQYNPGEEYPDGAVVVFDCQTQEKTSADLREGRLGSAEMNEDYLVYSITDREGKWLVAMNLENENEILRMLLGEFFSYSLFEDEILIGQIDKGYSRCNLKTGEYKQVGDTDFYQYFWAIHATEDGYLGMISENGMYTEYAYISKEDFDRGGEVTVLTEDGWPIW